VGRGCGRQRQAAPAVGGETGQAGLGRADAGVDTTGRGGAGRA
jgi:hypothetical protein